MLRTSELFLTPLTTITYSSYYGLIKSHNCYIESFILRGKGLSGVIFGEEIFHCYSIKWEWLMLQRYFNPRNGPFPPFYFLVLYSKHFDWYSFIYIVLFKPTLNCIDCTAKCNFTLHTNVCFMGKLIKEETSNL